MGFKKTIYVDLDGTLTYYTSKSFPRIGEPVSKMVEMVKAARAAGHTIVIFTARLSRATDAMIGKSQPNMATAEFNMIHGPIENWCSEHLGFVPHITCIKGMEASEFWDDRAVRIGKNTGEPGDLDGTLWASLGGSTRTE